jgi:predicted cupin superfamily sugar epimerase
MTSRSSGPHPGQRPSPAPPTAVRLDLQPHPEGGWFRRTWTAPATVDGERPAASAIYYLLVPGERSRSHVVDADELWLWHGPGTLTLQMGAERRVLGPEAPQAVVPAGTWQAAEPGDDEVLVTCVVSPGFVWEGFRLD